MDVFVRQTGHDKWIEVKEDEVGRKSLQGKLEGIAMLFKILDLQYLEVVIRE